MTDRHENWIHRLSEYVDGAMEEAERVGAEAHLSECEECRRIVADLRRVVEVAHALPERPPERDLWPGIARVIGARGTRSAEVIALPTAVPSEAAPPGLFLSLPQLAAAAVILMLLSVSATLWIGPGLPAVGEPAANSPAVTAAALPVAEPPKELAGELDALEQTLREARGRLDPETLRILEKNLTVIERAIEDSRRALVVDPGNAFLQNHLNRAWERKLLYLEEATRIAEWSG